MEWLYFLVGSQCARERLRPAGQRISAVVQSARRALTYVRIDLLSPRSIAADKRSAVGAKSL